MSFYNHAFGLLGFFLIFAHASREHRAQEPKSLLKVEMILPSDGASLDLMQMAPTNPKRFLELSRMLAQAIAKDPAWWDAHLKKANPGEPVAYDARLGVTREEFDEYLQLVKEQSYKKSKSIEVKVKRDASRVVLNFGDQVPELGEVELDLKADTVKTAYGVATRAADIAANEGQRATGPWNGFQWKLQNVDDESDRRTSVQFAIGVLKNSGRGIVYYKASRVGGNSPVSFSHVLQYDIIKIR